MDETQLEQLKKVILDLQTGIPFIDDHRDIKEKFANVAIQLFKSQSMEESLRLVKGFRFLHGPIPSLQNKLTALKNQISILNNQEVYTELEFLLTEYTCLIAENQVRRKLRKPILNAIGYENKQTTNHPVIDYIFREFISKVPYSDLSRAVEIFSPFNDLFNNLDDDFLKPGDLSKAGRKDSAIEQEFIFNLRNTLKKWDGSYMNNMILILTEIKSLAPDVFSNLPYLTPDSLRKSIERGSKLKSYRLTLNAETATKLHTKNN